MSWIEVRVDAPPGAARDAAVAALIDAGGGGVVEQGPTLVTFLPDGTDVAPLRRVVRELGGELVASPAVAADWTTSWAPRVGVQRVGRIAVAPPWRAAEIADAEIPIVIEPAMAFGTGEHETTRGVLRLVQAVVHPGDRVADLGAGSAVLAIAAAKLGAARVAAIELDPDAIGNAEENVARNGVADRVMVLEGDAAILLPLVAPVRVVLANIISSVLVALAPMMQRSLAPGGCAIVSGILAEERDDFVRTTSDQGWAVVDEQREGEWWSSVIARR